MTSQQKLSGMRAFYALILGQLVSTVGSGMTRFGLGIWVLAETGDATAYTILLFFAVLPVGLGSLVAGPLVDRWNRRLVMIISNIVASLSTLVVAILFFLGALDLWHLYIALFVNGIANAFILPALDSSVPLLVPRDQLDRASGMTQTVQAMEAILSPALAGFLIGFAGLGAIFIVDFVTFSASILALVLVFIPQPQRKVAEATSNLWQEFLFGIRYIRERPAFIYLMGLVTLTMFLLPGLGYAVVTPLILTFADEQALGLVVSGFGVGSLIGGILLTVWGGPKRRVDGILLGMFVAGLSAMLISLRESASLIGVSFIATGISFVFMIGLNRVIWQLKAAPEVLGRIFSLRVALAIGGQAVGILIAGPMVTFIFEPMLMEGGILVNNIGQILGTGVGRGMAFMFLVVGLVQVTIVAVSFFTPSIRYLEDRLPDYIEPDIQPAP